MPLTRRHSKPPADIGPASWPPQPFGRIGFRSVKDPIVEPRWNGVRILARLERGASGAITATSERRDRRGLHRGVRDGRRGNRRRLAGE